MFIVVHLEFVAPPMVHVISRHKAEQRAMISALEHDAIVVEVPSFRPYDSETSHPVHEVSAKRWQLVNIKDVKP